MVQDDDKTYVIFDIEDGTYWCDSYDDDEDFGWRKDPARAKRLQGFLTGARELREVDCEAWLRHRLKLFIDGPDLVENCRKAVLLHALAQLDEVADAYRSFEDDEELEELDDEEDDEEEPPPWPPCTRTGS